MCCNRSEDQVSRRNAAVRHRTLIQCHSNQHVCDARRGNNKTAVALASCHAPLLLSVGHANLYVLLAHKKQYLAVLHSENDIYAPPKYR